MVQPTDESPGAELVLVLSYGAWRRHFGGDSIYNFSRIIKVIGTLSVKGDDTPERPHRLSCSIDPFERREDAALLEALAD